jgi:GntR family transcriptional regulator, transcriptional repressor for pyruvate dehydrogenase complex
MTTAKASDMAKPAEPSSLPVATRRRSPKVSERVARDLAAYIVDSKLPPATRLPPEKEMAEQLGVGRTTLREALRLLESRGIVSIRPGPQGGPVVRHPDPSHLASAITLMLQFEGAQLDEVVKARTLIESTSARLAAKHITAAQLKELKSINANMALLVADNDAAFEMNRQFHLVLAKASGNVVLTFMVTALLAIYDQALQGLFFDKAPREAMVAHHERIIKALESGDPDATEAAVRAHVEDGWRSRKRKYPGIRTRKVRWEV